MESTANKPIVKLDFYQQTIEMFYKKKERTDLRKRPS